MNLSKSTFTQFLERSHRFASIWWYKSLKKGDGSSNLLFSKETHDTNLGQSSVVEFGNFSLGLGLLAPVGAQAKGIEKVEWDRVGDLGRFSELGVGTWFSSPHVVCSVGLGEMFQETNEKDDLPLGGIRKSIPLLWWRSSIRWEWLSSESHWPWPVDSVGLDDVSDEGGHGNTSVLDLCLAKEAD